MTVTIQVDELSGLREFATEWLRLDPWEAGDKVASPWWRAHHPRRYQWAAVLPLHTDAGFDLGLLYAHHKGHAWAPCFSWPSRSFPALGHVQQLMGHAGDDLVRQLADLRICGCCGGNGSKYFGEDAHAVGYCELCGGSGKNPQANLEALKACLLAMREPCPDCPSHECGRCPLEQS